MAMKADAVAAAWSAITEIRLENLRRPPSQRSAAQPNAASFSIVCILNLGPNYTRGREGSKKGRKEDSHCPTPPSLFSS